MALLLVPNLLWLRCSPKGFEKLEESRLLRSLERTGQILCVTGLLCLPFPDPAPAPWSLWLGASLLCMALYEAWWVKYFRSARTLADFHSGLWGIPLAGATLPTAGFLLLGVYAKSLAMSLAAVIFGVGHIGIHWQHHRQL